MASGGVGGGAAEMGDTCRGGTAVESPGRRGGGLQIARGVGGVRVGDHKWRRVGDGAPGCVASRGPSHGLRDAI